MRDLHKNETVAQATAAMIATFNSENEAEVQAAAEKWSEAIFNQMVEEYETYATDRQALASRGYRQLTSEEKAFYSAFSKKLESPKASYADSLEGLPVTIINDVYRNLVNEHPLLNAVNFRNVGYSTKLVLNNHTATNATWSTIPSEITQAITSSFKTIDLTLNKLSCYALLPLDLIRMGATFLDNYVRTIMTEAMATALEAAIVAGDGNGTPIGMNRKLDAQAVITSGAYEAKTAVSVTDFSPETYGNLIATYLLTADNGIYKGKINNLGLICNPVDYYKTIMPATTVLNTIGQYIGNIFPVPTQVIPSAALSQGTAIIGFLDEYTCGIGAPKTGSIEVSDDYKFVEDMRTFRTLTYANGRAFDNSSFAVLDISGLEPAAISVKTVTEEAEG